MKDQHSADRVIQVRDVSIGGNIRAIRKEAGFKQADVVRKAQLSGIDISVFSYNRIEKGTQNPTVSLLLFLCKLLHCDVNSLFGWNGDDAPAEECPG